MLNSNALSFTLHRVVDFQTYWKAMNEKNFGEKSTLNDFNIAYKGCFHFSFYKEKP